MFTLAVLMMPTMPVFGSTDIMVSKVVFKNLVGSETNYPALAGVRFYSDGYMIEAGNTLVNNRLYGETTAFTVEASGTHPVSKFRPLHMVETYKSQQCDPVNYCTWAGGAKGPAVHTVTINFKTDVPSLGGTVLPVAGSQRESRCPPIILKLEIREKPHSQ